MIGWYPCFETQRICTSDHSFLWLTWVTWPTCLKPASAFCIVLRKMIFVVMGMGFKVINYVLNWRFLTFIVVLFQNYLVLFHISLRDRPILNRIYSQIQQCAEFKMAAISDFEFLPEVAFSFLLCSKQRFQFWYRPTCDRRRSVTMQNSVVVSWTAVEMWRFTDL